MAIQEMSNKEVTVVAGGLVLPAFPFCPTPAELAAMKAKMRARAFRFVVAPALPAQVAVV